VNTGSLRSPWFARVYTMLAVSVLAVTVAAAEPAQPRVTIEAMLTKGPEAAPVTIVEFSDFQ
jgi:hypothetical protein